MTKYVTATGRALRLGRTTRKSHAVKRPNVKPLPIHLQCHPQALHRTPIHPGCRTITQMEGALIALAPFQTILFRAGAHLTPTPNHARIEVEGCGTWYHPDLSFAFAWAKGARSTGLTVNVYIND